MTTEIELAGKDRGTRQEFCCSLCQLTVVYHYYGKFPPFCKSIELKEEAYVMKDPFTHERGQLIVLGSHCVVCGNTVCVSQECSLFYTKRFCSTCLNKNLEKFPIEIQNEVNKKKTKNKPNS